MRNSVAFGAILWHDTIGVEGGHPDRPMEKLGSDGHHKET